MATWDDVFHSDLLRVLLGQLDLDDVVGLMAADPHVARQVRVLPGHLVGHLFDDDAVLTGLWLAVLRSQPQRLRQLLSLPVACPPGLRSGGLAPLDYARELADGGACENLLLRRWGNPDQPGTWGRVERLPGHSGPAVVDAGLDSGDLVVLRAGEVEVSRGWGAERTSVRLALPAFPGVVTQVSCGAEHVAMVADGLLWVAGRGLGALPGHLQERPQDPPQLWTPAPAAMVRGPVMQVATDTYATYALNGAGEIWAWGDHDEWVLGLPPAADSGNDFIPTRVRDVMTVGDDPGYTACPRFKAIAVGSGLLAALSVDGKLYACGEFVKECANYEDEQQRDAVAGWLSTLTPIPTPELVDSILLTRAMPDEVGDGFLSYVGWNEGGRWLPDAEDPSQTDGDIAAGGLLARLADGTVFAALQQQRVPGLARVEAMAECGSRITAFQVRHGDRLVTVVRNFG